jgi:hypothetical protein
MQLLICRKHGQVILLLILPCLRWIDLKSYNVSGIHNEISKRRDLNYRTVVNPTCLADGANYCIALHPPSFQNFKNLLCYIRTTNLNLIDDTWYTL